MEIARYLPRFLQRRKRLAQPNALFVFGIFFLLLPLVNYIAVAGRLGIPTSKPYYVLVSLGWPSLILLIVPLLVAYGLLRVKKWGWWLFLGYAPLLVAYNIYTVIVTPVVGNLAAVVVTCVVFAAIAYFLRRDISAPYMKMYPRGWRFQKRAPVVVSVRVDRKALETRDISARGFFVEWPDCPHEPNDAVAVEIMVGGSPIEMPAGIVRVDENGAGIAFRELDSAARASLTAWLKESGSTD